MSDLVARARFEFRLRRAGGAALAAVAAAAAVGGLALADGVSATRIWPLALAGAALGGALAVASQPWTARPAAEVDPAHDRDGLLRACLALPASHPFRDRLLAEAERLPLRFRPASEVRPLALWAGACLVLALWLRAEPAFRPGEGGGGDGAGAAAGDVPAAAHTAAAAPLAPPAPPEPRAGRPADPVEWWTVSAPPAPAGGVVAGRDPGAARAVVDRYLRLRAGGGE